MPLLNRANKNEEEEEVKGPAIPAKVDVKLRRGRKAMLKDAPKRRVAYKFWTADHFWFVNERNRLSYQPTITYSTGGGKPPHRIRNQHPFLQSVIEGKVSAATQRVPGYDVTPSTDDRKAVEAAKQSARVAVYLYDKCRVRHATVKTVTNALVQREAFAMPYFDPNVGPYTQQVNLETGEVEVRGRGEIKIATYNRSEVLWEPGVDFDASPWWAVEHAQPVDVVEKIPGFVGGKLKPNATTADVPTDRDTDNMVLVTTYLERPCPDYPNGRRMVFANSKQIVDPRKLGHDKDYEPYPCMGPDGKVVDEPVLHRLSYTVNPDGEDMGLAERLIDLQRTIDDCWNKLKEWKNRCLNPQMLAAKGSFPPGFQRNDIPGYTYFYNPAGPKPPEWETPPSIPRELFDMLELAIAHMRALASDVDVQPDPRLAGKTATAAIEQNQLRWQSFLGDLAEWHSRLMRHMLSLAQVYYDEPRQITLQGEYEPYTLANFTGQDLMSQVNIRVMPDSLESMSRQAIRDEVGFIAATWPGAVTPEAGIAAIHQGIGANMLRDYENHISRAWRMVTRCFQGMPALEALPQRFDTDVQATDDQGTPLFQVDAQGLPVIDPATGQPKPVMGDDIPGWLPRKQDNIDLWKQVFATAMTTPKFEEAPPEIQRVFDLVWDTLERLERDRVMREVANRDVMASGQGLDNAAKPQAPPPLPDRSMVTPR